MELKTYQPSGRVSGRAVPMLVAACVLAVPVAWAYAWTMGACPGLMAGPVAVMWTFVLALLVKLACRWGKVRNPDWMGWFGLAIGALFWYSQWVFWALLATGKTGLAEPPWLTQTVQLALRPAELFSFAWHAGTGGTSGISINWPVRNASVLASWLAELCLLLLWPMYAGRSAAHAVFCEKSDSWAKEILVQHDFEPIEDSAATYQLLATRPWQIKSLLVPRRQDIEDDHARLTVYACGGQDCFVSLENRVLLERNGDGASFSGEPLVERLYVPGVPAEDLLRQ